MVYSCTYTLSTPEMDQDRQTYTTKQENFKTMIVVAQVWKITIFDPQAALVNGAYVEAIT
jgi:hypothetical protein